MEMKFSMLQIQGFKRTKSLCLDKLHWAAQRAAEDRKYGIKQKMQKKKLLSSLNRQSQALTGKVYSPGQEHSFSNKEIKHTSTMKQAPNNHLQSYLKQICKCGNQQDPIRSISKTAGVMSLVLIRNQDNFRKQHCKQIKHQLNIQISVLLTNNRIITVHK